MTPNCNGAVTSIELSQTDGKPHKLEPESFSMAQYTQPRLGPPRLGEHTVNLLQSLLGYDDGKNHNAPEERRRDLKKHS